ncbi:TIGR03086 family metal-binding protein [Actinocrispum sp. NPDC049592]|uniref:TIGR03086 family metal-binding protein n=1 Tax=Actinocrispum sp. NPDC049592 TaxID=3154835 RepID=UPI00341D36C6
MDNKSIVNRYYDAWIHHAGDMSGVPLAGDFVFTGPVASFTTAEGYRAMARQAGAAVRGFRVRHQFAAGDLVCSVIDWEMSMLPGTLTAAEILQVRDGEIVRGELIYDAQDLRQAMARPPAVALLETACRSTADMLGSIGGNGWAAPSGCARWTVRQAGNHLVGGLLLLGRIARREPIDPAEVDAQRTADTDHLGTDPVASFQRAAARAAETFSDPVVLEQRFDIPAPGTTGLQLATISTLEVLVHGWDIASGAEVPYKPDDTVVTAVGEYAMTAIGDASRGGPFGPVVPVGPDADPFTALLGHLGRRG